MEEDLVPPESPRPPAFSFDESHDEKMDRSVVLDDAPMTPPPPPPPGTPYEGFSEDDATPKVYVVPTESPRRKVPPPRPRPSLSEP